MRPYVCARQCVCCVCTCVVHAVPCVYGGEADLVNHLLQLLIGHVLAELLGDPLQVFERNLACFIVIE